jgi:hypothetical protein
MCCYNKGWVWAIYYSDGQETTDVAFVHAEGNLLVKNLAAEIIKLDKGLDKKFKDLNVHYKEEIQPKLQETKKKYFKYIENECGEIHFEGLPTDKDAGSVKVKIENIYIPPSLNEVDYVEEGSDGLNENQRISLGDVLQKNKRLTILAKPGGGKSTLIKRLATAYAFPTRKKLLKDSLPRDKLFPLFIRCRELGGNVTSSITDIIYNIPNRAEISDNINEFKSIVSTEMQQGKVILLIDGLDEISDERNRVTFVNQLRTFIATYPNVHIVITSREAGFRAVGGKLESYCKNFKLSSLNRKEIKLLSEKWHVAIIDNTEKTKTDALNLAEIIINDNRILSLAENPLLLTTLLFVKRWAGYLPTKKSVLYEEMIKLLMVTWNVEGHEQLDIEEAEPQLAFVAYWMTSNGQQTITLQQLKSCLLDSRNHMPEILGYTKVSVSDFIKRVESRSSLLIMSGHEKLEAGEIVPIYEFLHLSFQEYLTAKAVVESYLPSELALRGLIDIITPYIEEETWKEVFPIIGVLLKRDSKELIEFLLQIPEPNNIKKSRRRNIPVETLGSCIANEVQITPELLDRVIEKYAKNKYSIRDRYLLDSILQCKFGEAFKTKVQGLYFEQNDDEFLAPIGGLNGEIYIKSITKIENVHDLIILDLKSDEKCNVVKGLLTFMTYNFTNGRLKDSKINDSKVIEILELIIPILSSDDFHLNFPGCWSLGWLNENIVLADNLRKELISPILMIWLDQSKIQLSRVASWALKILLRPGLDLQVPLDREPDLKSKVLKCLNENENENEFDLLTALFLSLNIGIDIGSLDLKDILLKQPKHTLRGVSVKEYASSLGVSTDPKKI